MQSNFLYLKQELSKVAAKHGEVVLNTPHNPISMGKYNGFPFDSDGFSNLMTLFI